MAIVNVRSVTADFTAFSQSSSVQNIFFVRYENCLSNQMLKCFYPLLFPLTRGMSTHFYIPRKEINSAKEKHAAAQFNCQIFFYQKASSGSRGTKGLCWHCKSKAAGVSATCLSMGNNMSISALRAFLEFFFS